MHSTALPPFHKVWNKYWARIGLGGKAIRKSLKTAELFDPNEMAVARLENYFDPNERK